jgi:hypothetical protein
VFGHVTQAKLRTEMARACRTAAIAVYSPPPSAHLDLACGRGALKQVGERVGQANLSTAADVYTHAISDAEIDRELVGRRAGDASTRSRSEKSPALAGILWPDGGYRDRTSGSEP